MGVDSFHATQLTVAAQCSRAQFSVTSRDRSADVCTKNEILSSWIKKCNPFLVSHEISCEAELPLSTDCIWCLRKSTCNTIFQQLKGTDSFSTIENTFTSPIQSLLCICWCCWIRWRRHFPRGPRSQLWVTTPMKFKAVTWPSVARGCVKQFGCAPPPPQIRTQPIQPCVATHKWTAPSRATCSTAHAHVVLGVFVLQSQKLVL
jgi:hypothetical protein